MSVDYTAYAIVGYSIPTTKRFAKVKVPNCEHPQPSAGVPISYCPECGKKIGFHIDYQETDGWEDFTEFLENIGNSPKNGFVFEDYNDIEGGMVWFGHGISCHRDGQDFIPLIHYDEIRARIQQVLQPYVDAALITLDEKRFGLHVVCLGR